MTDEEENKKEKQIQGSEVNVKSGKVTVKNEMRKGKKKESGTKEMKMEEEREEVM